MKKVVSAVGFALLVGICMTLAPSETHAQGMCVNDKYIAHLKFVSDGIEIKLTKKGLAEGQAFINAKRIAARVLPYVPKAYKPKSISLNKLGFVIQYHALAYLFRIKRDHANPVNVSWREIR